MNECKPLAAGGAAFGKAVQVDPKKPTVKRMDLSS